MLEITLNVFPQCYFVSLARILGNHTITVKKIRAQCSTFCYLINSYIYSKQSSQDIVSQQQNVLEFRQFESKKHNLLPQIGCSD